ncbi:MAG: methionyl-tRNA formyltransferase [Stutzerimonas stutzeri]|jgi:hypothetical protein|nr:MAG: methionyl-tRNA formyltransferase [Stutzerimonas stutzeri]
MARIEKLEIGPSDGSVHPSKVHARVKVFGGGADGPIVQIDTFGSANRDIPGKLSQTIQLDRTTGRELLAILQRAYG